MAGVKVHAVDGKEGASISPSSKPILGTDEWKLAQRITATPPFQRSAFLTNFLLYICNRKLSNREDEISEYQIGVQALGRPAAYYPGEDNIVRSYARMLRRQLEEYFANEGRNEPLRIVIPRGRYVPVFEANTQAETPNACLASEPPAELPRSSAAGGSVHSLPFPLRTAAIAIVLAAAIAALGMYSHFRTHPAKPDLYTVFWKEFVGSSRITYIVTGDSGFALLQDMTRREVRLPEYVNGDFDKWFPELDATMQHEGSHFDADRFAGYTSVADLNSVVALMRLPEISAADVVVRNARDVYMGEIRVANLILLGGPLANPWIDLFEPTFNFRLQFSPQQDERSIVNAHPQPGEQLVYQNGGDTGPRLTYVILSFLPNLDGNGHALLIQGLNMSGTQAGVNFVLNKKAMAPILQRARLSDGSIGRFEVVLETQSIGVGAPDAHPVAVRCGTAN